MDKKPQDIAPRVAEVFNPFFEEIISLCGDNLHSLYLVGSALTVDYVHNVSDINSMVLLHRLDFQFLQSLWDLGKRYKKKNVAAPLCLTPEYVMYSIDAFPIEFLDFKTLHVTIIGTDLLDSLEINREHLRLQCEREIKSRLINLRQGYISCLGDERHMSRLLIDSVNGSAPLFRAILYLLNQPMPLSKAEAFSAIEDYMDSTDDTFVKMLQLKQGRLKVKGAELRGMFTGYYNSIERLGNLLNSL